MGVVAVVCVVGGGIFVCVVAAAVVAASFVYCCLWPSQMFWRQPQRLFIRPQIALSQSLSDSEANQWQLSIC